MSYNPFEKKTLRSIVEGKPEREIINIEVNTELAKKTIKKLESDFKHNIIYIAIGALIGILTTILSGDKTSEELIKMNKLLYEKNELENQNENSLREMRLEINTLKIEIKKLKHS